MGCYLNYGVACVQSHLVARFLITHLELSSRLLLEPAEYKAKPHHTALGVDGCI
jgi:hypothetical protein